MNHTQDIQDLFDILHDGHIEAYRQKTEYLELKIGIQYLAELLSEDSDLIYLEIQDLEHLSFTPWADNQSTISNIAEIVNLEPEIQNCDYQNNLFHVHCSCDKSKHGFSGGTITINFSLFNIKDETGRTITMNKLRKVADKYWGELD